MAAASCASPAGQGGRQGGGADIEGHKQQLGRLRPRHGNDSESHRQVKVREAEEAGGAARRAGGGQGAGADREGAGRRWGLTAGGGQGAGAGQ